MLLISTRLVEKTDYMSLSSMIGLKNTDKQSKSMGGWKLCQRKYYVLLNFYFSFPFLIRSYFPSSLTAKLGSSVTTRPGHKTVCIIHLHSFFHVPWQSWKSCALKGLTTLWEELGSVHHHFEYLPGEPLNTYWYVI